MKVSQLRAGVIMTYLNIVLSSLIPFFYTPVMLRLLGQSEYGLYSLANSVVGYLSLLSFGLGSTIVRYIAKYRAQREKEKEERVIGLFVVMYSFLAILVLIVGWIVSCNVEPIFQRGLTETEISEIAVLVRIMAFNTAISFPISVFGSIIVAHEKYVYRQVVTILSTVAAPCCNLIALYLGFGSVGLSVVTTILQFAMLPLNAIYCFKVLQIRPKFRQLPIELIKELVRFSAFVFLGSIVDMLFWATDKVILGMLASTTAVAIYNVGASFNSMMTHLSTAFSGVLTPKVTVMVTKDATPKQLTELFIRVGRLQYLLISLALSGFIVFGKPFLVLWAGPEYESSYYIALVTLIPLSVPLIQNTGISIVMAQNKHQFRSVVYLIIAIANVISTYLAVPRFGGLGAAVCSGVSYILGQGIIMNIYYYKVTKIDIPAFWKNILKMSIIPVVMLVIGLLITTKLDLTSWWVLILAIVIYTVVYAISMYFLIMNNYEKDVIRKPILKVLNKLRKSHS